MTYILRMFFYSIGLALLLGAWAMNPSTAQFNDLLGLLHASNFWQIVGLVAATLIGADMVFSGKWNIAVDVVFNVGKRLRDERKSPATH